MAPQIAGQTPWQTVGPFFHDALSWPDSSILAGPQTAGERIEIAGRVTDANGEPVPDAMVEIWQADAAGRYHHPDDRREDVPADEHFTGFGRVATGGMGEFRFSTIRPGRVPGPGNSLQAPHIAVGVLGRGLLKRLVTRLYFSDRPENEADPILALVPEDRRHTLIATPLPGTDGVWRFDISLQGENETVFFEV
jgi:protocatechuate 3,4-dioxygenase alpha subunit